jgi:hypothetical protein
MKKQDYHASINADVTPQEAFEGINNVSAWWARKVKGSTNKLNDTFRVDFGQTFVTFQITEFVPNKKIVWNVIDCNLHWIKEKKEWKNTTVVFEISKEGNTTKIDMTHIGLVPGVECYDNCEAGWNEHFGESLFKYLTQHQGMPV